MIDVILKPSTEIYRKLRKNEVCNKIQRPYTSSYDRILSFLQKYGFGWWKVAFSAL